MAYKSKYEDQLANALNRVTNRKEFSYDFNADPMYQMYKDQYTKLGNEAAQNAAASVSALTGGYGNSYATTAAAQANQQYLTKLNEVIPSLYEKALNKYMIDADSDNAALSALSDADARDYEKYRGDVADEQWQKSFDENNRQWQAQHDQALKQFEESVRQYNEQFAYGKERDAIADSQWQQNYNQALKEYEEAIRQYNENMAYKRERDAVSDSQWQAQYNANLNKYNQQLANAQKQLEDALNALNNVEKPKASYPTTEEIKNTAKAVTPLTETDNISSVDDKTMQYINIQANVIKNRNTSKDEAAKQFGYKLDDLVAQGKISETTEDMLFEMFMNNKL